MKIPHSRPTIMESDILAISNQLKTGAHAPGETTIIFEKKLSKLIKNKFTHAVQTGTSAIHLALLALKIKKSDEIILPSYVCQSILSAINYTQASPVISDINNKDFNISAKNIYPLISKNTKAIIVPHMFGFTAEINKIKKLNIPIIEDCSLSLGSKLNNKTLGNFGDISTFSFYATKVISTGQGGAVSTNSTILNKKILDLLKYDKRKNYKISYNYKLSNIQTAMGISQLNNLNNFINKRIKIGEKYNKVFQSLPIILPKFKKGNFPFRYIIQSKNKNELQTYLKKHNINAEDPIFKPLHQYFPKKYNPKDFPNTEKAHATALSIPIYPTLTKNNINYITEKINSFFI